MLPFQFLNYLSSKLPRNSSITNNCHSETIATYCGLMTLKPIKLELRLKKTAVIVNSLPRFKKSFQYYFIFTTVPSSTHCASRSISLFVKAIQPCVQFIY